MDINGKLRILKHNLGLILLEVIIAIAVLGIGIVMIMQLFSGGLRSGKISHDYTMAVLHAREKMKEALIEPVQSTGEFDNGYRWQTDVSSYDFMDNEEEDADFKLVKIAVKVSWPISDKKRSVEIVSLKTVSEEQLDE